MNGTSFRDRTPRLRDWGVAIHGMLRAARCRSCGHVAALPVAQLLRRFDGRTPIADLQARMVCSACGGRSVDVRTIRLCEPGCPRQRG